ncbi:hydrolase [Salinisphaera sp. T5B8]|uniref:carbon-nitrogen hydrolase family protein n=1 Tax=Salinisphaera sp. T5B8 TaxID=1304154 RepID=UPI00333EB0EF
MTRFLPVLAIQAPAQSMRDADDTARFEQQLQVHLSDFGPNFGPEDKDTPRLVVYPEMHCCPSAGTPEQRQAQLEAAAEPIDGPRMRALGDIARRQGIWLQPGSLCERGADGHLYNTAPVFSPAGECVAAYRKCFPWRPFEPYRPGSQFSVFEIPGVGRIGLAICYDIWFPEVCRQLAWLGAEVIINPVATTTSDRAQEQVLIRANAIFNQVFMVSVNASTPAGVGESAIIDPEGRVRAQLPGATAGTLTDVLNLDEVSRVRRFGTAGLNRLWSQSREDDPALELPMYEGRLDPRRWRERG